MKKVTNLLWTIMELIQMYGYAVGSLIHRLFIRLFPLSAAIFTLLFALSFETGIKERMTTDITSVVITLLVFAILCLLYAVDKLYAKVKERS